jgi:pyruvate dehydrogenase E2 component (dihydrolipoamide acetyltransferase)
LSVYEFRMPSLGADMEAGTLMRWLVRPGDRVERGDVVAVVDTEKSDIEVEIFASGVVDELVVPEGEKVPVGTLLAKVRTEGLAVAGAPPAEAAPAVMPAPPPALPAPVPVAEGPVREARRPASPAARRRAAELGLDLAAVAGSGPEGAVTLADLEASAAPPLAAPTRPGPPPPAAGLRRVLAATMERSNREIPHYYLATTVDLGGALAWLAQANLCRPVSERLLPAALFVKAVALAARKVPEVNGHWLEGAFHPGDGVQLGIAISRRRGEVVVPAIRDADQKSPGELMAALRDLVARARAGSLRSSEVAGSTLTITSLGDLGAEAVWGVIYPPQVALVGIGRVVLRPWAVDGAVGLRSVVTLTLAADHRASDGFQGSRFLAAVDAFLQKPESL